MAQIGGGVKRRGEFLVKRTNPKPVPPDNPALPASRRGCRAAESRSRGRHRAEGQGERPQSLFPKSSSPMPRKSSSSAAISSSVIRCRGGDAAAQGVDGGEDAAVRLVALCQQLIDGHGQSAFDIFFRDAHAARFVVHDLQSAVGQDARQSGQSARSARTAPCPISASSQSETARVASARASDAA